MSKKLKGDKLKGSKSHANFNLIQELQSSDKAKKKTILMKVSKPQLSKRKSYNQIEKSCLLRLAGTPLVETATLSIS